MELEILRAIQQIACPALDAFFIFATLLGETLPVVAVIAFVYWLIDREAGERIAFSLMLSLGINCLIKNVFRLPRPIGEDGIRSLRVETATGYSFPSGHTQNAATLYTFLALWLKRRWVWAVAAALSLLVAFSRLYLGVHYPKDVLVGLLLGTILPLCAARLHRRFPNRTRLYVLFALLLLPPLLLVGDADFYKFYGLVCGMALAYPLERRYVHFQTPASTVRSGALRIMLGLILLLVSKLVLGFALPEMLWFQCLTYFVISFEAFFVCPLLFVRLKI